MYRDDAANVTLKKKRQLCFRPVERHSWRRSERPFRVRHLNDDAAFEKGAALEVSRGAHASSPAPHAATFSCAVEMEIRLVVAPAMAPKDTRGVVVRRPVESAGATTETEAEDGRSVGASTRRAARRRRSSTR